MKKWIIVSFMFLATMAQAQKINYKELMEMEGITTVYVSEAMFKLIPKEALNANMDNVDLSSLINGMKEIYIFTTEDVEKKTILKELFSDKNSKATNTEMLMFVKDGSDKVKMFAEKEANRIKGLFLHAEGKDEFTMISIIGNFSIDEINKAISGMQEKPKTEKK